MSDKTVYRTADASVIAAWDAAQERLLGYRRATGAILDDAGATTQRRMISTGHQPGRFLGLNPADGIPEGWRVNSRTGYTVPDQRTSKGRAVRKALDALGYPGDPRHALPGMPADSFTAPRLLTCGARKLGAAMYAIWGACPGGAGIDTALWSPCPLSQYYAAVEQDEAAGGGDDE
jgi:hypothetical protein